MSTEMFGSPTAAFGFLLSPQEVQAAEDSDEGIAESEYVSKDSHLMFNKPYHLITTDSIIDDDDDEGKEEEAIDYGHSLRVLNFISALIFANLSIVLPSNLLYVMSLMDSCIKDSARQKGLDGMYLVPLQEQPGKCLDPALYLFAASISLSTLFQWIGGPMLAGISKFFGGRKKPVLVFCMLLSCLGNMLYAVAPGPAFILLGRSLVGLSSASMNTCFAYITSATSKDDRVERIAGFRVFGMGGLVLSAVVSFLFSFIEPPHNDDLSFDAYTGPAFLMVILSLVAAGLLLILVYEPSSPPPPMEVAESFFFSGAVILSLFYAFLIGFLSSMFEWMVAPLCAYRWGWEVTAISIYFLGTALLMFPAMITVKMIKKKNIVMKIGDRFFLFVAWAVMPLGLLLMWVAFQSQFPAASSDEGDVSSTGRGPLGGLSKFSGYPVLAIGTVILFVSFTWGSASQPSALSSILPPQARGKMMGLATCAMSAGRVFGPIWGAYAFSALEYQPDMMFGLLSDLVGVALVFCLIKWKQLRPGSWIEVGGGYQGVSMDAELDSFSEREDLLD